jgi:integrase/recombinase XerD
MRIGEALGLRHENIAAAEREITVVPRVNVNGARCKSAASRVIPVSADLVRLYADYLHEEYGDLDLRLRLRVRQPVGPATQLSAVPPSRL